MRKTSGAEARLLRLARMQELVYANGPLPLKAAAQALNVTEMTVRRDLAATDAPLSCLGGYVLAATLPASEKYSLDIAGDEHAPNKRLACERAAQFVEEGDCIFVDCGTTMAQFAEALPTGKSLSVVCYSLNVANILSRRPNIQLMLMGGLYNASSATFYSDDAVQYLERLGVNKAFISAGGVQTDRGVSCSNFHEVPVKQAAMRVATERFLVIDESKLGRVRPAFFGPLDGFSQIIVGGAVPSGLRKLFKGMPLLTVPASG
nr:DeoR/GlpR family DNA-binding transcription regulator [uncultured Albidiferax sp.]